MGFDGFCLAGKGEMEKKMETIILGYMGGCQNYGPFLGTLNIGGRINRDPKRDHNFDNHPYRDYYKDPVRCWF